MLQHIPILIKSLYSNLWNVPLPDIFTIIKAITNNTKAWSYARYFAIYGNLNEVGLKNF